MEKLKYEVLHDCEFSTEDDFLETILKTAGVENVKDFLYVNKSHTHDPFLFRNMKEGIELLHNNIGEGKKIYLQIDCDVDGDTSGTHIYQFIKEIAPETEIVYGLHYKKEHGIFYSDVKDIENLSLIIVPDAGSDSIEDCKQITEKMNVPVLILDHHEISNEIYNYATLINCMDGEYPNKNLSGVGVVHKFCLAYCRTYGLNEEVCNKYLDLVALGMIADAVDMRSLEARYYTLEGLKDENRHNLFIKEIAEHFSEDMKLGHTIHSYGWIIAPKINGVVRYGKDEEQIDLFRAFIGEKDDREYQPRRKSKDDPKPPTEIHSLQKTMARVAGNVKARQDNQVRDFMKALDKEIIEQGLERDSIIILNASEILTKKSVSGLVANKLIDKYKRPVVILKPIKNNEACLGGSARGYEKGEIKSLRDFMLGLDIFDKCAGHDNAFGVQIQKDLVQTAREKCNKLIKLGDLVTVHEVDYSIKASKLTSQAITEVASAYKIWGNKIPEPTFIITDIDIEGKDIVGYGDNNGFIKFKYKDIDFIKKYCKKGEFEDISLRDRSILGENRKPLKLTVIGNFVFNEYQGVRYPQVKIKHYYTEERIDKMGSLDVDDIF